MRLYGTPLSHFARKVRMLLDGWGAPYEFVDVGNVAEARPESFGGNPNMTVPVLVDERGATPQWVTDSDHIASYLCRELDPDDRYRVLTTDVAMLNARAIMNGVMSREVTCLLAERTGLQTQGVAYFDKARTAIANGLDWLETRVDVFDPKHPGYLEFHLVAMWDHLAHYDTVTLDYPAMRGVVARASELPCVRETAPPSRA